MFRHGCQWVHLGPLLFWELLLINWDLLIVAATVYFFACACFMRLKVYAAPGHKYIKSIIGLLQAWARIALVLCHQRSFCIFITLSWAILLLLANHNQIVGANGNP